MGLGVALGADSGPAFEITNGGPAGGGGAGLTFANATFLGPFRMGATAQYVSPAAKTALPSATSTVFGFITACLSYTHARLIG
jgi:hypothetical protein